MDHAQHAEELFRSGCNCAQAVFCAFGDVTGMEGVTAQISSFAQLPETAALLTGKD